MTIQSQAPSYNNTYSHPPIVLETDIHLKKPATMPSLTRVFSNIFISPKVSKQEQKRQQVESYIATLEQRSIADLNNAVQTIILHTEGVLSGTWTCHTCQYQNAIILLPGKHPLGILRCHYCEHVCCDTCTHSRLMQKWYDQGVDLHARNVNFGELPYVSVCRACGLSWRAIITRVTEAGEAKAVHWGFGRRKCACGATPSIWKPWIGFRIEDAKLVEGSTRTLLNVLRERLNRLALEKR